MRTVFLTTASLLLVCFIGTAFMETAGFAQTIAGNHAGVYAGGAYGAPACAGPGYCEPLVPGCCEYAPSCRCRNIWDGYCQEKNSGCGWPAFCWPRFRCPDIGRCFSRSHVTSPTGGPCCVEPVAGTQITVESTGKSVQPSPTINSPTTKPAPAKSAPPKPVPVKPLPVKPVPVKTLPVKTTKAGGGWQFLPAGDMYRR